MRIRGKLLFSILLSCNPDKKVCNVPKITGQDWSKTGFLMKSIFFVLYGLLISFTGQSQPTRTLTAGQMKKDVLVLKKALEKYHPGLYWYTSNEDFKMAWDSLDTSTNGPLSEEQFLELLLPVVAKVNVLIRYFILQSTSFQVEPDFP